MEGKVAFEGKTKTGFDIIIRYPRKTDLHELHRYINTLSQEKTYILFQGEEITVEDEQKALSEWLEAIEKKVLVKLLVEHEEKIIGITEVSMANRAEKHIGHIGVSIAKEYRNQGIGRLLMETLLEEAKNTLPDLRIVVLGVFSNNAVAIDLYKKLGFVEYGSLSEGIFHKDKYVDHIFMYKKVL